MMNEARLQEIEGRFAEDLKSVPFLTFPSWPAAMRELISEIRRLRNPVVERGAEYYNRL